MRLRLLPLICSALLWCGGAFAQQDDLREKLGEYLQSIDRLEYEAAQQEVDFIISSVQDDQLRNKVAQIVYNHFRDSKVMGSENLAVYVYDKWFATFECVFDEIELFDEAEFYAFLNRNSLIGCKAPQVVFTDIKGKEITVPSAPGCNIIYFYSATCPKCLYTAHRMREMLSRKNLRKFTDANGKRKRLKINLYAVYTGEDDAEWQAYVKQNLNIANNCSIKVYHLKSEDGSYAVPYAVVQTPRLFLTDGDSVIIGRNLDAAALEILLRKGL